MGSDSGRLKTHDSELKTGLGGVMTFRPALLVFPIVLLSSSIFAQQAAPPAPAPAVGGLANVKSPDVSADRRVTFRIAAPKASAVSVVCECLTLEEVGKLKQQQT